MVAGGDRKTLRKLITRRSFYELTLAFTLHERDFWPERHNRQKSAKFIGKCIGKCIGKVNAMLSHLFSNIYNSRNKIYKMK